MSIGELGKTYLCGTKDLGLNVSSNSIPDKLVCGKCKQTLQ